MAEVQKGYKLFDTEIGVVLTATIDGIDNLTAATVDLLASNGSTYSCTVVDAANRLVSYTVQASDFAPGDLKGQFAIAQGTNEFRTDFFPITVQQALG